MIFRRTKMPLSVWFAPAWDLKRKRIEELFIWHKLIDRIRQVKKRRVPRMNVLFLFALLGLS